MGKNCSGRRFSKSGMHTSASTFGVLIPIKRPLREFKQVIVTDVKQDGVSLLFQIIIVDRPHILSVVYMYVRGWIQCGAGDKSQSHAFAIHPSNSHHNLTTLYLSSLTTVTIFHLSLQAENSWFSVLHSKYYAQAFMMICVHIIKSLLVCAFICNIWQKDNSPARR